MDLRGLDGPARHDSNVYRSPPRNQQPYHGALTPASASSTVVPARLRGCTTAQDAGSCTGSRRSPRAARLEGDGTVERQPSGCARALAPLTSSPQRRAHALPGARAGRIRARRRDHRRRRGDPALGDGRRRRRGRAVDRAADRHVQLDRYRARGPVPGRGPGAARRRAGGTASAGGVGAGRARPTRPGSGSSRRRSGRSPRRRRPFGRPTRRPRLPRPTSRGPSTHASRSSRRGRTRDAACTTWTPRPRRRPRQRRRRPATTTGHSAKRRRRSTRCPAGRELQALSERSSARCPGTSRRSCPHPRRRSARWCR